MKVKYKQVTYRDVPILKTSRNKEEDKIDKYRFPLTFGKVYVVYSMYLTDEGIVKYLIISDGGRNYWYPPELFDITDNRLPSCWQYAFWGDDERIPILAMWGYEEIVNRKDHYDDLIERKSSALSIFYARRREIELSHPSPEVTDKAEIIEGKWIMCPNCCDAWECELTWGMIDCPNCSAVLLNPRYSPPGVLPKLPTRKSD